MATQRFATEDSYAGHHGCVTWKGRVERDPGAFEAFLKLVNERLIDMKEATPFEDELRSLAGTGMDGQFVEKLLRAVPEPLGWEIGEALVETLLEADARGIRWPWNAARDRRTPRASLPGADLIGFEVNDTGVTLVFGEVKTSSELAAPPGVMTGRGGMVWQLDQHATQLEEQHALLRWLRCRCTETELRSLYLSAVGAYVRSQGKHVLLIGVLVRDTPPHELDLRNRAAALADVLSPPAKAELIAVYVPTPAARWPQLLSGVTR